MALNHRGKRLKIKWTQNDPFEKSWQEDKKRGDNKMATAKKKKAATKTSNVTDLTKGFKDNSGIMKTYRQKSEQDLAKYTITVFVNAHSVSARDARNISSPPTAHTVTTGVNEVTQVFRDIGGRVEFNGVKGMVQGVQLEEVYRVCLSACNSTDVAVLEAEYNRMLEQNNFFQGKSLRFINEGVEFIRTPLTTLADCILPAETVEEYKLNILEFLTDPGMAEITKQRGVILHGPPGTGKTTSVKAMFRWLTDKKITCIFISDASFSKYSVEDVFTFINKYLAPCLVVFEDIDLVAVDRARGASRIIGPLLSAMNGVQEPDKPIAIVATTNRPEILDKAVTRPCRFDRKIKVDYPTTEDLMVIFERMSGFAAPRKLLEQSDNEEHKLTGAHVEDIHKTAKMKARKYRKTAKACLEEAVSDVKKHFMLLSPKTIQGFDDEAEEPRGYTGRAPSSGKDVFDS